LSQLKTRRKEMSGGIAPVRPLPSSDAPRWGHLLLLEKVGAGAFGEVYRAWDTKLEREVALKLLDARDCTGDPELMDEARMLARLRHPNVVTVHGVDQYEGRYGVWMDFIRGKTLEQVVDEHGAFSAREAALVGLEVTRALAEVHRLGLVHRDVKAQNVMREEGGRIVLMDFGLGHDTTAGPNQDLGGTPVYMAPELFQGEPASVRSDIYSAGVLLYHLVTQSYPVQGGTVDQVSAAHSRGAVTLMTDARPDLPSPFARVIEKATSPEPSRRYATAGQMNAALDATLESGRRSVQLSKRTLWASAATFVAAALFTLAWWLLRPSAALPAGATVLFTDIANATGDRQLDGVTELLRNDLIQSRHFNLLESNQINDALKRMTRSSNQELDPRTAREVALRVGAPLLVYGTLSPLGSGYTLAIRLERIAGQPDAPAAAFTESFEAGGGKNSLFDATHQASKWIRKRGGEAAKDIEEVDRRPEEATTSSWEALEYYAQGEQLNRRSQYDDAIAMYLQAVRVDPNFCLALMRVAQLENTLRRAPEAFVYWRRAVDALNLRPASRREELRIRGLYAEMTDDYQAAESALRTLILLYPQDAQAYHLRALALRNLGRLEEARDQLRIAQRLRPDPVNLQNLVVVDLMLGDSAQANGDVEALRSVKPVLAEYLRGIANWLAGDVSGADRSFSILSGSEDGRFRSIGFGAKAYVLAETGRSRAASAALREGIAADIRAGNSAGHARKLLAIAALSLDNEDKANLKTVALEAVAQDHSARTYLRAGTLLARGGLLAAARSVLGNLEFPDEGRRFEIARSILSGEIAVAEGRTGEGLADLQRAASLAPQIQPREYLAHALEQAGRQEEALGEYQRIVAAPAVMWQSGSADDNDPDLWTSSMLRVADLSARTGRKDEARAMLTRFLKLHAQADSDSRQTTAARKLLASL
jgi:serine/threonine-protein kinase